MVHMLKLFGFDLTDNVTSAKGRRMSMQNVYYIIKKNVRSLFIGRVIHRL